MNFTNLAESITKAISKIPVKSKSQHGWFQANEKEFPAFTEARNEAMQIFLQKKTRLNTKRLQQAHKKLKTAVKNVKNNWIKLVS